MIIRRKLTIPGLDDISSDDDTDDDIICLDDVSRQVKDYHTILIDDISSEENDDIIIVDIHDDKRKRSNEVWRKIIEYDIIDQQIKNLGIKKFRVNREVESYDLPSFKLKSYKRTNFCRHRRRKSVWSRLNTRAEVICLSNSDDDCSNESLNEDNRSIQIEICKDEKMEPPTMEYEENSRQNPVEISDSESDSDSESEVDENRCNSWSKLIHSLNNDQYQIEFELGRETVARRIAKELQETKVDLIDRCLIYLGLQKCQAFLTATKRIEENGGMPTKDGSRRRTPGGVFLTLIKSDRSIETAVKEQIFLDNNDDACENAESRWWKSVEASQLQRVSSAGHERNGRRGSGRGRWGGGGGGRPTNGHYARKKEFKSYTLIDLDYFQCFKDFRYRYIPMVSNFPLSMIQEEKELHLRQKENGAVSEIDNSGDEGTVMDIDLVDDEGDEDDVVVIVDQEFGITGKMSNNDSQHVAKQEEISRAFKI